MFHPERSPWERLIWLYFKAKMIVTEFINKISGTTPLTLYYALTRPFRSLTQTGAVEQRNIPASYTELEYVTMPASYYIRNTSITILPTYKVELEFETGSLGSSLANIFGGRRSGSTAGNGIRLTKLSNKGVAMYGFDSTDAYESGANVLSNNTRYTFLYQNGVITLTDGSGTVVATHTYTPDDTAGTPNWAINGYYAASVSPDTDEMKFISLRIWDNNGSLIVDYISAKNSNAVGMYDSVSDTLVTASNGTFTAGPNATPTPKRPQDIWCNNGKLVAVRHQSGLPLGYQLLSSLTADGRCFINTGIVLQEGDEIDLDYDFANPQPSSLPADRFMLGTANVDTSKGGTWAEVYSSTGEISSPAWYARFSSPASVNGSMPLSTLSGHLTLKQEQLIVNGETILTPGYTGTFQTTELTFFGRYDADQVGYKGAVMTASHFTVKNGNAYRYNGVMAKRLSDNALGVYDLVSDTFQTNLGDGTFTAGAAVDDPIVVVADGTPETLTITDEGGNTQTVTNIPDKLAVGDYKDTYEFISGLMTHRVGVYVCTGNENVSTTGRCFIFPVPNKKYKKIAVLCNYAVYSSSASTLMADGTIISFQSSDSVGFRDDSCADTAAFKAKLASAYSSGNPYIILFPLATETTEQTTPHALTTHAGTNVVEVDANVSPITIECEYEASKQL